MRRPKLFGFKQNAQEMPSLYKANRVNNAVAATGARVSSLTVAEAAVREEGS